MTTEDSMASRVRRIASDVFDVPEQQVTPETSPDNLESWDSLAQVNLVVALEQELGFAFTAEEMMEMVSIELITMLIEEKLAA